jgi:hypothetical protein
MHSRFASSTALGVALALAMTVAGAVAPAFASTPHPDIDLFPANPTITRPLGPLPQPAPEAATVTFQPDVRVNYLSKTSLGGGKIAYKFRVQNIGAASASNVGLGTAVYQLDAMHNVATRQSGSAGSIASLGQDQSQEITITCTPLPGYVCDGASLEAYVTDDLNPANNKAGSH